VHEPGKNAETFVLYRIVLLVIVIIVILVLVVIVILFPLDLPRDPFSQAPRAVIPPHHEVTASVPHSHPPTCGASATHCPCRPVTARRGIP
jgi:hypothetical protein